MTVGHTSIFYCNCQIQRADSRKGIEDCGNLFENMIIFVCLKISCFQTQPSSLFVRAEGSSEILASCMFNRREQLYLPALERTCCCRILIRATLGVIVTTVLVGCSPNDYNKARDTDLSQCIGMQ